MLILCGIARQASEIVAALLEGVDAEARDARDFEGEVDLVLLGELFELARRRRAAARSALSVSSRVSGSSAVVERQLAVDAVQRRRADLQVQIRALFLDELAQRSLTSNMLTIGNRGGRLEPARDSRGRAEAYRTS